MGAEPSYNLNEKGYSASFQKNFNNKRTNIKGSINGPYDSLSNANCGLRLDHQDNNTSIFGEVNKSFNKTPLNYNAGVSHSFGNSSISGTVSGTKGFARNNNYGLRYDFANRKNFSFAEVNKSFDGSPLNYNAGVGHTFNGGRSTISGNVSGYQGFSKYNNYGLRYDYNHKDTSAFVGVNKNFGTKSTNVCGGFKKVF